MYRETETHCTPHATALTTPPRDAIPRLIKQYLLPLCSDAFDLSCVFQAGRLLLNESDLSAKQCRGDNLLRLGGCSLNVLPDRKYVKL